MHTVFHFAVRCATVFLAISPFSMSLRAQSQNHEFRVNVPFAFESGSTHFAAGTYRIRYGGLTPLIQLDGDTFSASQMTMRDSARKVSGTNKLVFRWYGSHYLLKQVWMAGSNLFLSVPKSKQEEKLQLEQARSTPESDGGDLALLAMPR